MVGNVGHLAPGIFKLQVLENIMNLHILLFGFCYKQIPVNTPTNFHQHVQVCIIFNVDGSKENFQYC